MGKVAIVQFDDRPDDKLGPLNVLRARNARYAKEHGYHYAFARQAERDIPHYWNKVFLTERVLSSGFDIVAWLDTDAVIHDFETPIEAFFPKDEGFVFAADLPIWKAVTTPFNAGVFFCRGDFGRMLLREWQSLYPANVWKKVDGKWNFTDHVWAGPAYEQGAFVDHLFRKYWASPAFKQMSWKILQSPYPQAETFSLHFPSHLRTNTLLYLQHLREIDPLFF